MKPTLILSAFNPTVLWMSFAPINRGIHAIEQLIMISVLRRVTHEYRSDNILQTLKAQLEDQEVQTHKVMKEANEVHCFWIITSIIQAHPHYRHTRKWVTKKRKS